MMEESVQLRKTVFLVASVAFALPCLFFVFYTLRLIYVNLTMENAAAHRTGGMLIGAIAFPLAAIIFGLISFYCLRSVRRSRK
ncbi:MAG: hypothetical protein ACRD6X_05970 [Pyrinomonadaceae bacterium]